MACLDAHINQALHNIDTIAFLFTDPDKSKKDWIVTVAFYAGLHIVDAVLYNNNQGLRKHGQSHNNREELLKGNNKFKKIWSCYWSLHNESVVARYLGNTISDEHVDFNKYMPDEKLKSFLKEKLGGLIKSVANFLPSDKAASLRVTFQNKLKNHLDLKDEEMEDKQNKKKST